MVWLVLFANMDTFHNTHRIIHTYHVAIHCIVNAYHSAINAACDPQHFRWCHPCFFLCQFVQPSQTILNVCFSNKPLEIRVWIMSQLKNGKYSDIDSLNRPSFASLVAIARIESTSTIMFTIISVIATVGVMTVWTSSWRKKLSMRSKSSKSLSLSLASSAS